MRVCVSGGGVFGLLAAGMDVKMVMGELMTVDVVVVVLVAEGVGWSLCW